jgi:hypothetical protein
MFSLLVFVTVIIREIGINTNSENFKNGAL